MFAWFSTLWGKIALFVAAALALFVGKKIYDHGKRQEGREDERQDQRKELDKRLDKREDDESEVGRMSDDDLVDSLRSDKRKPG